MKRTLPRLHAVTDHAILNLPDYAHRAQRIAHSPDVAVHVRSGLIPGRRLTELVRRTRDACAAAAPAILVNDRVDVAMVSQADGVHLPSSGLPIGRVRSLVGPYALIGRSTHNVQEAQSAVVEGADYIFLGPIWKTGSHPDRPPLGLDILSHLQPVPVIAIGGVTPERVHLCLEAGAYGVAAVSSLWLAPDPRSVAEQMLLSFDV